MRGSRSTLTIAAMLGAIAGMGVSVHPGQFNGTSAQAQPNQNSQSGERNTGSRGGIFSQDAARLSFGREPNPWSQRRRGPGWTQAHVKRMAKKARNIKRHRAVMRRAK